MRILSIAVLVVFSAVASGEKYTSTQGSFKVAFPADARVKETKEDAGEDITWVMFEAGDDSKCYLVWFMDVPLDYLKIPTKKLLDNTQGLAMKRVGGKVLSSTDITFRQRNRPGRVLLYEVGGLKVSCFLVLDGCRMYYVSVSGHGDFATSAEASEFLSSFEITE
jgi:hypothetical protein